MKFAAIDVETANPDFSSICQIGIATFEDGILVEEWSQLINPDDYLDPFHFTIHRISDEAMVLAPVFNQIDTEVRRRLDGLIVVSHTSFDRSALSQACARYGIQPFSCQWLDSVRVARRAWPQFAKSGYGLRKLCEAIGYDFKHHDALSDAKAAANIVLAAIRETGIGLDEWVDRVNLPLAGSEIAQAGNPDGVLYGEVVVFTGTLSMSRSQAATLVASAGCRVMEGVTKHTTILIVGDQDSWKLAGYDKSAKHRKAEDLIGNGVGIRIITERSLRRFLLPSAGADQVPA